MKKPARKPPYWNRLSLSERNEWSSLYGLQEESDASAPPATVDDRPRSDWPLFAPLILFASLAAILVILGLSR